MTVMAKPAGTLALVLAAGLTTPLAAGEAPAYFSGKARYMRDAANCTDNGKYSEARLEVTAGGMFGHELSCTFLDFHADVDPESGEPNAHVALAICGDDSGITRPDAFALVHNEYDQSLTLQSQSEYVLAMVFAMTPQPNGNTADPFEAANYLSGTYVLCPTP